GGPVDPGTPAAPRASDGLVADQRRPGDERGPAERIIDGAAGGEPGRDGVGADTAVARDRLVTEEEAVGHVQDPGGPGQGGAPIADAAARGHAPGAGVGVAAAGHVVDEGAVEDGHRPVQVDDAAALAAA